MAADDEEKEEVDSTAEKEETGEAAAEKEEAGETAPSAGEETTPSALPRPSLSKSSSERTIATRGVPAGETLWLPPHDSPAIRAFQDKNESATRNAWSVAEVVQFVFPARYQPVYHQVALAFMQKLAERTQLAGADIAEFVSSQNISKATFYNRVLPRLRRVGMIKIERQTVIAVESKRKYRPMTIHLSKTFGNYLAKIGDSWLAAVDESRSKYDQQKKLGNFEKE
ncbi:MAG: hypothetical protein M1530_00170 [Candidatus Marsarchaeota archaeon]|nr:hypothetical protein [Candidatus Marsarchaeota archaeon]